MQRVLLAFALLLVTLASLPFSIVLIGTFAAAGFVLAAWWAATRRRKIALRPA
jgi:hypothetical protein